MFYAAYRYSYISTKITLKCSKLNFPDGYKDVSCTLCQVFGGVIHFFWLTVFAWTGKMNKTFGFPPNYGALHQPYQKSKLQKFYNSKNLVIGGYLIYICLVQVFLPKSISMMKFYFVGYGIPSFIGKKTLLVFFSRFFVLI